MDYYNSMPPQNQQPPMMQSMHYTQMVPPEIGQQQDLWDHDKHVSINPLLISSKQNYWKQNEIFTLAPSSCFAGLVQMDKLV